MPYTASRLHRELVSAGLSIVGCASDGRIDWSTAPTPAQIATARAVLAAHDPDGDRKDDDADSAALDGALSQLGQGTPTDRLSAVEALLRRLCARLRKRNGV